MAENLVNPFASHTHCRKPDASHGGGCQQPGLLLSFPCCIGWPSPSPPPYTHLSASLSPPVSSLQPAQKPPWYSQFLPKQALALQTVFLDSFSEWYLPYFSILPAVLSSHITIFLRLSLNFLVSISIANPVPSAEDTHFVLSSCQNPAH